MWFRLICHEITFLTRFSIQRETLNQAKRDLDAAQTAVREADMGVKRAREALNQFGKEQRVRRTARQQAETRVEELQDQIEQSTVNAGRLDALQTQLREAKENLGQAENSYQDAIIAKDNIGNANRQVKNDLDQADREVAEAESNLRKVDARARTHAENRSSALRDKNLAENYINAASKEHEDAQLSLERKRDNLAVMVREANKICNRIEIEEGQTFESIDARIKKLAAQKVQAINR